MELTAEELNFYGLVLRTLKPPRKTKENPWWPLANAECQTSDLMEK